jgi:tetratricopeptide (TPR) repeat protein
MANNDEPGEPGCVSAGRELVRQAQLHIRKREFVEAERLLLRGLALFQEAGGEDDLGYSVCLNNLGTLYHVTGDAARAEPLLRQVVEIRRRVLGEFHPRYLASLQDLAEFYRSCNDEAQAAFWQARAEEVEKKLHSA